MEVLVPGAAIFDCPKALDIHQASTASQWADQLFPDDGGGRVWYILDRYISGGTGGASAGPVLSLWPLIRGQRGTQQQTYDRCR
jgi:hypothetical protein